MRLIAATGTRLPGYDNVVMFLDPDLELGRLSVGRLARAHQEHVQHGADPAASALIGIDIDDPAAGDDLAVLRDLLARRVALVDQVPPAGRGDPRSAARLERLM
jgi:hypothetical protein